MKPSRKTLAPIVLEILKNHGEMTSLELEKKVQEYLPGTKDPKLLAPRRNGSSTLRNLLAWTKIDLKKRKAIEYPGPSRIRAVNSIKAAQTKPAKPTDELEDAIKLLLENPAGRSILKLVVDLHQQLQKPARAAIQWKPAIPPKPPKPEKPTARVRLEALSADIKHKQKTGELPKLPINRALRDLYAKEGHTTLKTIMEWKKEGKLPRHKEHGLLLWKKTPSQRFIPTFVFSQKQVVPIGERETAKNQP